MTVVAFAFYSEHNKSIRMAKEREMRDLESKREKLERKAFEDDIAFSMKELDTRDIELYRLAIARDVELLSTLSNVFNNAASGKSEYRKRLEDEFVWWLNHHIKDCERIVSRIGEGRRNTNTELPGLLPCSLFEIYDTKCDCGCCGKE